MPVEFFLSLKIPHTLRMEFFIGSAIQMIHKYNISYLVEVESHLDVIEEGLGPSWVFSLSVPQAGSSQHKLVVVIVPFLAISESHNIVTQSEVHAADEESLRIVLDQGVFGFEDCVLQFGFKFDFSFVFFHSLIILGLNILF